MATAKENLQTAYDNCCAALAALYNDPKPSYSVGGRSYSWNELRESLTKDQYALLQAIQAADGPFECDSYGR